MNHQSKRARAFLRDFGIDPKTPDGIQMSGRLTKLLEEATDEGYRAASVKVGSNGVAMEAKLEIVRLIARLREREKAFRKGVERVEAIGEIWEEIREKLSEES